MSRRIIGIHGLPGAGKDSIADYLRSKYEYGKLAFADELKHELSVAFQVSPMYFNSRELKNVECHELALVMCQDDGFVAWYVETEEGRIDGRSYEASRRSRTPRWLMQRWGDYRRSQDNRYMVKKLIGRINNLPASLAEHNIVIPDVRRDVEAEAIAEFGNYEIWEVVRADNPHHDASDKHLTNAPLSMRYIDAILLNNSTLDHLFEQVDMQLRQFGR